MRLSFDADHLRRLLDLSRSAERRSPNLEQVLDPMFWRDDMTSDRRALLEGEIRTSGIALSATREDVDLTLIGPGLVLVGDHGVYLMANLPNDVVTAAGVPHVAYAAEVNPDTLPVEQWWEAKRESFGPDDGTVFLPEEMIRPALELTLTSGKPRLFTAGSDRRRLMSPTFGWPHIFARSRSAPRRSLRRNRTGTRAPSARSAAAPAGRAAGAGTRPPSGS